MAYTDPWDETVPDGATAAAEDIDTFFHNLRRDIRERLVELLGIVDFEDDPLVATALSFTNGSFTTKVDYAGIGTTTDANLTISRNAVAKWTVEANALRPNAADIDVGTVANPTRNVYASNAVWAPNVGSSTAVDLTIYRGGVATLTMGGAALYPETDSTFDLGSTTNQLRDIHVGRNLCVKGQTYTTNFDNGTNGGAIEIDWSNGYLQTIILSGNATFTFVNAIQGAEYKLRVAQNGVGGHTVTWPAEVDWGTGGAPTLTTTPMTVDHMSFLVTGSKYEGVPLRFGYTY